MASLPPYAPVATRSLPSYTKSTAKIDLHQEVSLHDNSSIQRELYESLSEIYSIIVVLELVEKSYLKDALITKLINPSTNEETFVDNYTPTVLRLINQYNSLLKVEETQRQFHDLATFKQNYLINCPLATRRLEIGVPATMEHTVGQTIPHTDLKVLISSKQKTIAPESSSKSLGISSRAVAETTGSFITLMDALKLNYKAKDQLYPLLSDLVTLINQILGDNDDESADSDSDSDGSDHNSDDGNTKANKLDFEGRQKLVSWLVKLNNMNVEEELSSEDVRQFLFDLESAYKNFYTCLE